MDMYGQTEVLEAFTAVRRPIQCEGIARGPDRTVDVAVIGSVNPQFWGALASLAPVAFDLVKRALD
jgi:hypothetical protein